MANNDLTCDDRLLSRLIAVHMEGDGLLLLRAVTPDDVSGLVFDKTDDSERLLEVMTGVLAEVDDRSTSRPVACAGCRRSLRTHDDFCVGIAYAAVDSPSQAIGFLICDRCSPDEASPETAAKNALSGILNGLRQINVTGRGGTA